MKRGARLVLVSSLLLAGSCKALLHGLGAPGVGPTDDPGGEAVGAAIDAALDVVTGGYWETVRLPVLAFAAWWAGKLGLLGKAAGALGTGAARAGRAARAGAVLVGQAARGMVQGARKSPPGPTSSA